jgi:V8-like Glu-specific endopeptidase
METVIVPETPGTEVFQNGGSVTTKQQDKSTCQENLHESVGGLELGNSSSSDRQYRGDFELADTIVLGMESASNRDDSAALDAYHASFASLASQAIARERKYQQLPLSEAVYGTDDRRRIDNTRETPFAKICYLTIVAADNSRWIGTGWFAKANLVVTAGHCLYIHDRGGWVKSVTVIPGSNGNNRPFGQQEVSTRFLRSTRGWVDQKSMAYDYGAIILPTATGQQALGSLVGTFGYGAFSNQELAAFNVNISGYPGDKEAGTQWYHGQRLNQVLDLQLQYEIDTYGGQSGAPVWIKNEQRTVVGIHNYGGNYATRMTANVMANIDRWSREIVT